MPKSGSSVVFTDETKHGKLRFPANTVILFEDGDAADYFVKAGWAKPASGKPNMTIGKDELDIDPETVMGNGPNQGLLVNDIIVSTGG